MKKLCLMLLMLNMVSHEVAAAENSPEVVESWEWMPAMSFGFSYPLVVSGSMGVILPLGMQEKNNGFPSRLSLRLDGELGLGGGSVSSGLYIPAGGAFAVGIKAVRLRTWLLTWNESANRNFDGLVVELVTMGHLPGKIGLGRFTEDAPGNHSEASFNYVYVGVGW